MPLDSSELDLPSKPGVYIFRRSDGRARYIGKASDLRSRIRSYFSKSPDRGMVPKLIEESDKVDFIVTQSPSDALILEREMIRKEQPRWNSQLKDSKSYPFIAITSHELPRIMYTRNPPSGAKVWGPFPDAGAAKLVIKLLRRHFGIRDNRDNLPFGFIESDDEGEYHSRIRAVEGVLDGNAGLLIESLQSEMDEASEEMNYERAARIRDMIAAVQRTVSEKIVSSRFYQDCDAVGFSSQGDSGFVVILNAKDGAVQGQVEYPLVHRGDVSDSVSLVLSEHYSKLKPPKTLLVPSSLGAAMEEWLIIRRGGKISVRVPLRGELARLRGMADRNAEIQVIRHAKSSAGSLEEDAADEGAQLLGLESLNHLVCFDMSQNQGEGRVGASVVFRKGRPAKKEYRTYRVKTGASDDLRMMSEVVVRWAKRQDEWPDLVLLDGGETHLSHVTNELKEMGIGGSFAIAALAKREERLHIGDAQIVLDRHGRVLIHARDEAHRFVNRYHRKARKTSALSDPLEEVDGLGAKKIQAILRHFGGRKGLEHASVREIRQVPGIGKAMAERIHEHLHGW
ncbi:MAG: excinuclease ABC subunit UvrC [Candidatus Thalassarchaeaceae archaeon]|jgi:excinuclease ABC subunit C|nr:excinuclease ABC subunit UvrC [Candidatus Thalassarchaeaceae archaeon]